VCESFVGLGTTCTVCVTRPDTLAAAVNLTRRQVQALDAAASRFRPDSELARLQESPERPVPVSDLLFCALDDALEAARQTEGLVDPTVGQVLELLGYDRDFAEVAPVGPTQARFARVPGWKGVHLDRRNRTVTVPAGVHLDLGATAKAACADRAAAEVAERTGAGVLVNLGGDIAVAGPAPEGGWSIKVADRHDAAPSEPGVTVAIADGGLATSGTAARRWQRGGQLVHHLVDPVTGAPARPCWRTVTVTAATCLAANTASTAAVILGEAAPAWLADRGLHARLVADNGTPVAVGQWPLDALHPAGRPEVEVA